MIGIIDMGGGMRGIYTSGIYDYLLEQRLGVDYAIGVSAGAANLITFLAGQHGRTRVFYSEYSFRRQYMSVGNWLRDRNYFNLDYVYATLSNHDGEYPLDYPAFAGNACPFTVVATDAVTGQPTYFSRADISQDHYDALKASSAVPAACRPYPFRGRLYFDGGVAAPLPYQKALDDGCDQIIVLLTRPADYIKPPQKNMPALAAILRRYPRIIALLQQRHERYNQAVREVSQLEQSGRALLVAPASSCGVDTFVRDKQSLQALYQLGYQDGRRVAEFISARR